MLNAPVWEGRGFFIKSRCIKIVNIKRENWNHKFRVVARQNGKLVAHAKWNQKFNLTRARSIFKSNNTFRKEIIRTKLTNVSEVIDFSDAPRKPSGDQSKKFQYFIEGFDRKNNIKITARSRQFLVGERAEVLKAEAFESFYERYAQARGADYNADTGRTLFEEANASITRQGFVYYTKLIDF